MRLSALLDVRLHQPLSETRMKRQLKKAVAAIALCAAGTFATHAVAQEPDIKLWQLSSGTLTLDKGWLTAMSGVGTRITIPVAMYVIQHPRGLLLFDTGNNVRSEEHTSELQSRENLVC